RDHLGRQLARADLFQGETPRPESGRAAAYTSVKELVEPLQVCYRSLVETGQAVIADGRLTDVLRRTAAFGLTLVRLDLRQHAARHAEALDATTRHRGLGSYLEWDESQRQSFLVAALRDQQPLAPPDFAADDNVRDVLDTFELAGTMNPESLSAFVVSMAQAPSDVLAVEAFQ